MDDELYVAFDAKVATTSNDPTIAPDGEAYNISAPKTVPMAAGQKGTMSIRV